jgi:hypothetical protein
VNYSTNMQAKSMLDQRELQMLEGEMHSREKTVLIAFLMWALGLVVGPLFLHRLYLNRGQGPTIAGIIWWVILIVSVPLCIVLIGFLGLFVDFFYAIPLVILGIIDAFSITTWVDEYNASTEYKLVTQLLAAKGIVPGGFSPAQAPAPAPVMPSIAVNVAAASNAPAQAWGAPTAQLPQAASSSSGRITYVESGRSATLMVNPGDQILIGRDPSARVRLSDPKVSRRHALLQRSGADWLVRDLGATNPTRLLGPGGVPQSVQGEIRIQSGQLLIGDVLVTLFQTGQ